MTRNLTDVEIYRIVHSFHADPFAVLGAHPVDGGVAIRAFRPDAEQLAVLRSDTDERVPMQKVEEAGLWEAFIEGDSTLFPYQLELTSKDGSTRRGDDSYRFTPVLTEYDLQLLGEGTHYQAYEKLGAHPMTHEGVEGVLFAVWAPEAKRVSVVGDFNRWDGRRHTMRRRGATGFWEIFIPGMKTGTYYKYEVLDRYGRNLLKADPYAFASELRPATASQVWDLRDWEWGDQDWMERRATTDWAHAPLNIYEVYLPAWARSPDNPDQYLNYRELAHMLADYVRYMGYTHVELLPISEFPYDGSWGYQVTGYFSPTRRLGTPDDFRYFVDHLHQRGIGVLVDWVPAHFPRDAHGLGRFDGTALYEHADPRQGEHKDWGTYIFNYGRSEVRNFLVASGLFWLDQYHIDGLRVDAVASMLYLDYSREPGEWVPNRFGGRENLEAIAFLKLLNEKTHEQHPGILTMAEESTAFPMVTHPTYLGGLGFDFKWNMGWMNDTLSYIQADPIYRRFIHDKLTFGLMYAFGEKYILPISHDEVVHLKKSLLNKMPGDRWKKLANLRLYLGFMYTHPGKTLLFQGQDIGQWTEFSEDRSTDWHLLAVDAHQALQRWMRDLLHLVGEEPAFFEEDHSWDGFKWIDASDNEQSVISYIRYASQKNDFYVVIHNFTPVTRVNYRLGVPAGGVYVERLNSDATIYGGSGIGNQGQVRAEEEQWGEFDHVLSLTLPPLGTLILRPQELPSLGERWGASRDEAPMWVQNLRASSPGAFAVAEEREPPPAWVQELRAASTQGLARVAEKMPDPPWVQALRASSVLATERASSPPASPLEQEQSEETQVSPPFHPPPWVQRLRQSSAWSNHDL